jgi:hypothetical protein
MTWNVDKIFNRLDSIREAVLLPIGGDGEYFTGAVGFAGQEDGPCVLDFNRPPGSQPGLWCHWVPTKDRKGLEWDGGEKFYHYVEWLEYLIEHFLTPWGYVVSGTVKWSGEEEEDNGTIFVENNVVKTTTEEDVPVVVKPYERTIRPEFNYHQLNQEGVRKAKTVSILFSNLLDELEGICGSGREIAIVRTKLEEASFFAKKAVAVNPDNQQLK